MSNLKNKIKAKQFVITAEIVPPLSAAGTKLLHEAGQLKGKVDAINITDAAAGKTSISSFAAAAILVANGHEPILQVTCRDRNRIALAGDLIGAAAQGIENLLILRGDDPKGGDQPDAKPVFDFESIDLLKLARDMRDKGELPSARKIDSPPQVLHRRGRRAAQARREVVARAAAEEDRGRRRLHSNAVRLRSRRRARVCRAACAPKASRRSSASSSASGRSARRNPRAG